MNEKKYEILYKEIQSLIKDFTKKKNEYARNYKIIKFIILFFTSLSTLAMGLTFIDSISLAAKIVAIVLSTLSTIAIGWDKTIDYKKLWQQRTDTLVQLCQLKRIYKAQILPYVSEQNPMDKETDKLFAKLKSIMTNDLDKWDSNLISFGNN